MKNGKDWLRAAWFLTATVTAFCLIALIAMCSSCTTIKVVTVEPVKTDTLRITKQQRDSIYLHDSTYIREKGDTLLIERWHTQYRERLRIDTMYQHSVDSVPVPYPVEVEVERRLSWWQRTQMYAGDAVLLLLLGGVVYWFIRLRLKF